MGSGTRCKGGRGPASGHVPTPVSCMKSRRCAAPFSVVKSLVNGKGEQVPMMAVLTHCCVWQVQWMMMCVGVQRPYPQGQVHDSGGLAGWNCFVYNPVKAWLTASWSAVDVVQRVYSSLVRIFWPCSLQLQLTAWVQSG